MKVDKSKWRKATLGTLFDIKRGGSPRPIQNYITNSPDGINWIKIGDATDSKYITSCKEKIKPEGMRKSRFVKKGDFLLSNSMSFGRPYILDIDGCIHDGWLVLSKKEEIDYSFFYYLLGSPYLYNEFSRKAKGAVVNNLNIDLVSSVEVSIPSIHEQTEIVAELDRIQGMIDAYKAQIADLDALAQSIFLDTFGDPITNSKGWKTPAMNSCLNEMFIGPFGSALKKEIFVEKDEAYCMMYEQKHAIKKTLDFTPHYLAENTYNELSRFEVFPGDIIVSCRGTIGEMYVLPDNAPKGIIHSSLMKIRINKRVNLTYFLFALNAIFKNQRTKGACIQMAIKATDLKKMLFPLPPISLQELFATRVKTIEALKEKLREQVADCELLMAERMQYYFS